MGGLLTELAPHSALRSPLRRIRQRLLESEALVFSPTRPQSRGRSSQKFLPGARRETVVCLRARASLGQPLPAWPSLLGGAQDPGCLCFHLTPSPLLCSCFSQCSLCESAFSKCLQKTLQISDACRKGLPFKLNLGSTHGPRMALAVQRV